MKTTINYLMMTLLAGLLWQCTPQAADKGTEEHGEQAGGQGEAQGGHGEVQGEHEDERVVMLSEVQIASAGITTGAFDTMNVSGYINANGIFDLPPENIAAVNAPMAGIVKSANYLEGSYVNKGAELLVLQHPDYIKLQEEYLSVLSGISYLEAEYRRQRALDSANVAARKALQRAEAEYHAAGARKRSLEKQLAYIGLNPEKVAEGQLTSNISVKAPISGYITQLNVHRGEFVQPEQELYELINTEHMHLELNVYERDIAGIKKGQPIRFTVPSLGSKDYEGTVYLVGKSFDAETKTVKVHGHFDGMKPEFRRGLYIEAAIFTGDERVRALPEEAVVRDQGKNYIFIRHDAEHGSEEEQGNEASHHQGEHPHPDEESGASHAHEHAEGGTGFRRLEVVTGISRNGMIQIVQTETLPANPAVVTSGAYDIFAEMKKGAGGHGHAH